MTLSKLVTDGRDTWLESRQYYGYSKHEALKLFRDYLKANGYKVAQ